MKDSLITLFFLWLSLPYVLKAILKFSNFLPESNLNSVFEKIAILQQNLV